MEERHESISSNHNSTEKERRCSIGSVNNMNRGLRYKAPKKSIDCRKEDYSSFLFENKRNIKRSLIAFGFGFFLLMTYVYLGAILFFYVEHCWAPYTPRKKTAVEKMYLKICEKLKKQNEIYMKDNSSSDIMNITNLIADCNSIDVENKPTCVMNQDNFFRWVEFTISVCFTVGYGNVVPLTDIGKVVTILYAVPGIAFAITTYSFIAKVLLSITKIAIFYIEIKKLNRKKIENLNIKTFISQVVLIIMLILIQAAASTSKLTENYRFSDAVYFMFIALTTIGFGDFDFDAGAYHQRPDLYILSSICYFGGFGLIGSLLTVVSEMISNSEWTKIPDKIVKTIRIQGRKTKKKYFDDTKNEMDFRPSAFNGYPRPTLNGFRQEYPDVVVENRRTVSFNAYDLC